MTIKNILLIDDDPDDAGIFMDAIAEIEKEITCFVVSNGIEGLKFITECLELPSLIFLDLNMPKMGGKECLLQIKNIPLFEKIPVIIYTTSKLMRDIDETKRMGASGFLTKPQKFTDLVSELFKLIGSGVFNAPMKKFPD